MPASRLVALLSTFPILAVLAGGSLAGFAAAQLPPLEPQTVSGVTYVTGGVGQDETQALRQMEGRFNLRLLFARQSSGEYLANVQVSIRDRGGRTILDTVAEGPRLLAQVPPGAYTVVASSDGRAITRQVNVPSGGAVSQAFYWP